MSDRLRGHTETIGERLERDLAALRKTHRTTAAGRRTRLSSWSA
jgi:hypothetical protein